MSISRCKHMCMCVRARVSESWQSRVAPASALNAPVRTLRQHGAGQIEDRIDQAQNLQWRPEQNMKPISIALRLRRLAPRNSRLTAALKYWLNSRYCWYELLYRNTCTSSVMAAVPSRIVATAW